MPEQAAKSSYVIVDSAVVLLKILGGLVLIGAVIAAINIHGDDDLSRDTRDVLMISQLAGGLIIGTLLMAAGAVLDIFMANHWHHLYGRR